LLRPAPAPDGAGLLGNVMISGDSRDDRRVH
jgi:hypothetical protein